MTETTDRIERKVLLEVPRSRVWRAVSNAEEFGQWFNVNLQGQSFAPGKRTRGQVLYPGYDHLWFDVHIERMEPERYLSWRWHPAPVEKGVDYSQEPTTLVELRLEDQGSGTMLTIVESGFDQLPPGRRLDAFRMNSEGWGKQSENLQKHVAAS